MKGVFFIYSYCSILKEIVERMLKEYTVSPVCSLAWQHSILYSCNNITHSSSGHASSFILSFDTFIISSCLFTPASYPTLFFTFTPVSFLLPLYISYFTSSPILSLPTFMSLLPLSQSILLSSAVAPRPFITVPLCMCRSFQAGATLGLVLSPSLSLAYLFLLDPWNKAQPDVWLPEAGGRCMEIHHRLDALFRPEEGVHRLPEGREIHSESRSLERWKKVSLLFFYTFCSPCKCSTTLKGKFAALVLGKKKNVNSTISSPP